MELVLLALERGEEAADAGVGAAGPPRGAPAARGRGRTRDVGGDGGGLGEADHFAVEGAVLGGGPRGDGALLEGAAAVGDDEVGIEVDGVAEALAAGAGAVGIVEGEEARLGLAVGAVAGGALECGGKPQAQRHGSKNRRSFDSGGCVAFAQDDSLEIQSARRRGGGCGTGLRRIRGSRSRWRRRCGSGCRARGRGGR